MAKLTKKTTFGANTGSYYGSYSIVPGKEEMDKAQQVKPVSTSSAPPPIELKKKDVVPKEPSTEESAKPVKPEPSVIPEEEAKSLLEGINRIGMKVTPVENAGDFGVDMASYKIRRWNEDKNKKVDEYVEKNALSLPEVNELVSDPAYSAKIKNDIEMLDAMQAAFQGKEELQSSSNPIKDTYFHKQAKHQAKGFSSEYGKRKEVPFAVQKALTGRIIPSLASEDEKLKYIQSNGLAGTPYNSNEQLYKKALSGAVTTKNLEGISATTKKYGDTLMDTSAFDYMKKVEAKGQEIDKTYKDVVLPNRKKFEQSNPELKAYYQAEADATSKMTEIQKLEKIDKIQKFKKLTEDYNTLLSQWKDGVAAKQEDITAAEETLKTTLATFNKNEEGKYLIEPDKNITDAHQSAIKEYEDFIGSLKSKDGSPVVKNESQLLKVKELEKKVELAAGAVKKNIEDKSASVEDLQKKVQEAYGEELLKLRSDIDTLESQEIMQMAFDDTDEDIKAYRELTGSLSGLATSLKDLRDKALSATESFESTDPVEQKYKQSIGEYSEMLGKSSEKLKDSFLYKLYEKYGDNISSDVITNEYLKRVNSKKYESMVKEGFLPAIDEKTDAKLADLLQSQEFQFGDTKDKLILLDDYYSKNGGGGLTKASFLKKYNKFIYEPLSVILIKTKALELKKQSIILQKTDPSKYEYLDLASFNKGSLGLKDNAMPMSFNKKTPEYRYAEVSDKILNRIVNTPIEKQGWIKDVWLGLKKSFSEGNNWLPVLGGFLEASEQKAIYDAYKAEDAGKASFEQKRLISTIEGLRTVVSEYEQDGFTAYNLGNKYFPMLVRFIGEMYIGGRIAKEVGKGVKAVTEAEAIQNTGVLFNNFAKLAGANDETLSLLSKISTMPAGFMLRAFISANTAGSGSILAKTYEKLTPYAMSVVNPESLGISGYRVEEAEFTSFAKAYMKSNLQVTTEFMTEEMGFLIEKPIAKIKSKYLEAQTQVLKKLIIKNRAKKGILSKIFNNDVLDVVVKSEFFKKSKEVSEYLSRKGGQVTYRSIQSPPIEMFEEWMADVVNSYVDIISGGKQGNYFDNETYFKEKLTETAAIMSPFLALSTIGGFAKMGRGAYRIASTSEIQKDDLDLEFVNMDKVVANSIAPTGIFRGKRAEVKRFISLKHRILKTPGVLSTSDIDEITQEIDRMSQKKEVKLAKVAQSFLDKRLDYEMQAATSGTPTDFSDYYEDFDKKANSVKSFIEGTKLEGKIDQAVKAQILDEVKDYDRLVDEINHTETVFNEFEAQKAQKIIPDSTTFIDFYERQTDDISKIEKKLEDYISGGGSVNFQQIEDKIKEIPMSSQKRDALFELMDAAKEEYLKYQNVEVDPIAFSVINGAQRAYTDSGKTDTTLTVENEAAKLKAANIPYKKITTGLLGGKYELYLFDDGTLRFGNAVTGFEFDYNDFRDTVIDAIGKMGENERQLVFFTLGKNKSLEIKDDNGNPDGKHMAFVKSIARSLAKKMSEGKINTHEAIKQMSLLNQALVSMGDTFVGEEIGDLNGELAHVFFKSNFNYDKDDKVFYMTRDEYNHAMAFLSAMRNFDRLISTDKIKLLVSKIVADENGNFIPDEDDLNTLAQVGSRTTKDSGKLNRKQVLDYIEPLTKNKNISRNQRSAIATVIMNTARNFVRMGVIDKEIDFLNILPQLKQLQINSLAHSSAQRHHLKYPDVLLEQQEEYLKGVYNPTENIILILKNGDISTVMHELGHAFRFMLKNAADAGNTKAAEKLKVFDDFANSEEGKKWYSENISSDTPFNPKDYKFINELWARSFERYLRDGGYGSGIKDAKFKELLADFKKWMSDIYESVKSGVLNIKLSKEVKDMFEDIVGNKIDPDKDLLNFMTHKFGKFSTRRQYTKKDVIDLLEAAKNGIDPAIYKESMEKLHKIVDAYKKQYVAQRYRGNSRLMPSELKALMSTPKHNDIDKYIADVQLFEQIVVDSRARFLYRNVINARKEALKRASKNFQQNIQFYTLLKKLARVDHRSMTYKLDNEDTGKEKTKYDIKQLEQYQRLLKAKPEDLNSDFIEMAEKFIKQSESYKLDRWFNEEQQRTENENNAEMNKEFYSDMREERLLELRRLRDYAVNVANVDTLKEGMQNEFFSIELDALNDTEISSYEKLLTELLRSDNAKPNFSKNHVDFTVKHIARVINEKLENGVSKETLSRMYDLNRKWSNSIPFLKVFTSRLINPFSYGMPEHYNLKDYLNFYDGIDGTYGGEMVQNIFMPLEDAKSKHREILASVFEKLNKFRTGDNAIKEGGFNRVGIAWLLSQKPDIQIKKNYLIPYTDEDGVEHESLIDQLGIDKNKVVDANGIGTTLSAEEFYEKNNNGVWVKKEEINEDRFKLYEKLLSDRLQYLKESIMVSFGEKPDWMPESDFQKHLNEQKTNPVNMFNYISKLDSLKTGDTNLVKMMASAIQMKKAEALKDTGFSTIKDLIDNIDSTLSDREREFFDVAISSFDQLNNGVYTGGVTMRDLAENHTGQTFTEVKNYAPILRYFTSKTDEHNVLSLEPGVTVNPEEKYTARSGINMSTNFIKTRKKHVSSIDTNAFSMLEKRFDQELFYMLHEPHRLVLKELFDGKPGDDNSNFFDKIDSKLDKDGNIVESDSQKNSKNYIRNMIGIYYKRGMSPAKLELRDNKTLQSIKQIVDDYRVAMLAPLRSSLAQITSTVLSGQNMLSRNPAQRLSFIMEGYKDILSSDVNDFIKQYAKEVYFRGLTDYDLGTNKESLNVSNFFDRYYRGDYRSEFGFVAEMWKSIKDNKNATEMALLPMVMFDQMAARASFMALYRDYCHSNGIDVDLRNPDKDAIEFALSGVRRTQNTDNELYRTGISQGVPFENAGSGVLSSAPSRGNGLLELMRQAYFSFKSFAIADQNNLAIKFTKAYNFDRQSTLNPLNKDFYKKDNWWDRDKEDAIQALAFNIAGKMAFNYVKAASKVLFTGISGYFGYMMNLGYSGAGGDDEELPLFQLLKGDFDGFYYRHKLAAARAKTDAMDVFNTELASDDDTRNMLSGLMYNFVKSTMQQYSINTASSVMSSILARQIHEKYIDIAYPEEGKKVTIGERMDAMYSMADDTDILGLISDVFGVSLSAGSNYKDSVLESTGDLANYIVNDNKEELSFSDFTSTMFFLSQVFGLRLSGRLPMSYPSLKKWAEDMDRQNKQDRKAMKAPENKDIEPDKKAEGGLYDDAEFVEEEEADY